MRWKYTSSEAEIWMSRKENKRNLQSPSKTEKQVSVCVPADKTNSTPVILIADYKRCVWNHLLKAVDLDLRLNMIAMFN